MAISKYQQRFCVKVIVYLLGIFFTQELRFENWAYMHCSSLIIRDNNSWQLLYEIVANIEYSPLHVYPG